ncbi:MAG: tRNA (guanosine(37)-N1)-methyltransferase TrmD, partial [bacterium]|nr:tRNA (guanosine(37)-N1)-methyltransferase TrmD [bacterium]
MIKFDIITIFPDIFTSYFNESIIKRAQKKGLVKINIHNLRDYTNDKHKTVDDSPYGGGPGMV